MPLAYSYLRFSSPQQAAGDSVRRQTEKTAAWCQRNNVQLDNSLSLRDEGVSAFKGKHRENPDTHALAAFLNSVKAGRIPQGSFLVVESLDRLSREKIRPALTLLLNLIEAGVKVVQLLPVEAVYDEDVEPMALLQAIMELNRGHSESKVKSERVGAAWARKRREAGARVVTKRLPGWVRCEGGKLVLDPEKTKVVRRVFALAAEGVGVITLAKRLNAEQVPVLARQTFKGKAVKWTDTMVYFLLNTRSVLGEYQPHVGRGRDRKPSGEPIADYYPRVIDDETWHTVQGRLKLRAKVGRGRKGRHVNLFAGLLYDARDGGHMGYKHYSETLPSLIVPFNARAGDVKWVSFPSVAFEDSLLRELREVKASDINGSNAASRRVETLSGEYASILELIRVWEAKMDNVELVDTVAAKLAAWKPEAKKLAEELAEAQREAASPISEAWGEFRSLADLLARDGSDELREKIRAALRRAIETVHCLFIGIRRTRFAAVRVQFRGTDKHRDYIIEYQPGKSNKAVKRPASWGARSFADAGFPDELDLRNQKHAERLEREIVKAMAANSDALKTRTPKTTKRPEQERQPAPATAPAPLALPQTAEVKAAGRRIRKLLGNAKRPPAE